MPHRVFFAFIAPSLVAMLLLIAVPLVLVGVQSLYVEHDRILTQVESCVPFGGCRQEYVVDAQATAQLRAEQPLGKFNGFGTYLDSGHLAVAEVKRIYATSSGLGNFLASLYGLKFYRALFFTLTYAFFVTPLAMCLGFMVALAVNRLSSVLKGLVLFLSLLPMIVTPLIGSLVVFWMVVSDGIIGASLRYLFDNPDFSLLTTPATTWVTLILYGIWTNTPFSFVVFYAGLQTVPHDTLESAMIDGASRWQRVRFVIMPHLVPLATFVALMQLMDNFRVFEPIVGFSASATTTSLSWSIFNDLRAQVDQLYGSASATSILTIIGVAILLSPVLVRTWRDFTRKAAAR